MRSLAAWLNTIYALHPRDIDLGLERIATLANTLRLTKFSCPVITVAGTNGKGSVIKFLESIYLSAGYRVAAFTSPHILTFNERLRINGESVSDEQLIWAFESIERARSDQSLSFFEFTTLAILLICQRISIDVLLLEVGLGGRLDAVNIVDPSLSVITNIDIDHTEWLGSDRESIGREKAGIIREKTPLVCGDPDPPQSVLDIAEESRAPVYCAGRDFSAEENYSEGVWSWAGPDKRYLQLSWPSLKVQNAATSLMVIDCLQSRLPVTQYSIMRGVKKATLPGRFEAVERPRKIIYDVAHNPQATKYLALKMRSLSRSGRVLVVVGMLKDKDIAKAVAHLIPLVDAWYVASLEVPRGASDVEIMLELTTQGVKSCYNFASVKAAMEQAVRDCSEQDRMLVFGSFYTVSMAKQCIEEEEIKYGD